MNTADRGSDHRQPFHDGASPRPVHVRQTAESAISRNGVALQSRVGARPAAVGRGAGDRNQGEALSYRFANAWPKGLGTWMGDGLRRQLGALGHPLAGEGEIPRLVLQYVDAEHVRPYRRRSQATFLVGVAVRPEPPADALQEGYPLLVRSLSNFLILLAPAASETTVAWCVTPERGAYRVPDCRDDAEFFAAVLERMMPLAGSHLVMDNVFVPDLPASVWDGCPETDSLRDAGRRLDALGVLPTPFPIRELLPPRDMRLLERLFSLGGLSYGNLSVRESTGAGFWMSGSGVDKSDLRLVGRDFLLVDRYDPGRNAMMVRVPLHVQPNRVSVDAIEHWTIYREHPRVGAVVHAHAWMDGAVWTDMNYPCGSRELAETVAAALHRAPDPARAVVGLRNHGVTITGTSLADIFDRVEGRLMSQIPMV